MLEIAQHILDIAENSIRAGAKLIFISIDEDSVKDLLTIEIRDDGCGMKGEEVEKAFDPFYTTKKVRRIGLGLPLLTDAARKSGGGVDLQSRTDRGTKVRATFQLSHIDRQPMGNITATLISLVAANPEIDFVYDHRHDGKQFLWDTRIIREEIRDVPFNHPEVIKYIRVTIEEGLRDVDTKA